MVTIDTQHVIEYIVILTKDKWRTHSVSVEEGFTNVYSVKERELNNGTMVSVEIQVDLVTDSASKENFMI